MKRAAGKVTPALPRDGRGGRSKPGRGAGPNLPLHPSWLSAMLLVAPLALLAELLLVRTHHRPLGAATFATAALLLWIFAETISRRFLDPDKSGVGARRIAWMLGSFFALAVIVRALA